MRISPMQLPSSSSFLLRNPWLVLLLISNTNMVIFYNNTNTLDRFCCVFDEKSASLTCPTTIIGSEQFIAIEKITIILKIASIDG